MKEREIVKEVLLPLTAINYPMVCKDDEEGGISVLLVPSKIILNISPRSDGLVLIRVLTPELSVYPTSLKLDIDANTITMFSDERDIGLLFL